MSYITDVDVMDSLPQEPSAELQAWLGDVTRIIDANKERIVVVRGVDGPENEPESDLIDSLRAGYEVAFMPKNGEFTDVMNAKTLKEGR